MNPLLNPEFVLGAIVFFTTVFGVPIAVMKWVNGSIDRAVGDVEHQIDGNTTRITALETRASNDRERIIRLEAIMASIKESQERMEAKLDLLLMELRKDHA